MHLTERQAYEMYESVEVAQVLDSVRHALPIVVDSFTLLDWGGQGLIAYIDTRDTTFAYDLCVKINYPYTIPDRKPKRTRAKEAMLLSLLDEKGLSCLPKLITYTEKYMVREYVQGMPLNLYLNQMDSNDRVPMLYNEWRACTDLFDAMHNGLETPYVICDLKSKNIVVDGNRLVFIDMGSCRREDYIYSKRPYLKEAKLGSKKYLHFPIEQLMRDGDLSSRKIDYYAFGVLLYETAYCLKPYSNAIANPQQAMDRYTEEYTAAVNRIEESVNELFLPASLADAMISALHPQVEMRSFIPMSESAW